MTAQSAQTAKGIKPSTLKQVRQASPICRVGHGHGNTAPNRFTTSPTASAPRAASHPRRSAHSDTPTPTQISAHHTHSTHASSAADIDTRTTSTRPTQPHPATMGDTATERAGGGEAHIGGVPNAQTARLCSRRPRVGDRVVNASGRGKWLVGVIVAVIPPGVSPAAWCSRRNLHGLFRRTTAPAIGERYVVSSGDRLFTPEKVRLYGD